MADGAKQPKAKKSNEKGKPPSRGKRQKGRPRRKQDCKTLRLVLVIGSAGNEDLDGAAQWVLERARALGGDFRLWHSRSNSNPLEKFRDVDISGGRIHPGGQTYRENPNGNQNGYDQVLADCQNCHGRIDELVIFHHGNPVDEAEAADRLWQIFKSIQVPVCRVVWWACNAAVALDVERDGWTDFLMRNLGGLAGCEPCGCDGPIELIWPTAGRCHLSGAGASDEPQTNDGKVHRARWGYPQPGGSLGTRPDPNDPHPSPQPSERDPAYGQDPPSVDGTVLGVPVGQKP